MIIKHAWTLINLSPNTKPISYKWIVRKKLKPDDSINKYKVRLVTKGNSQIKAIDCFKETPSPVTKFTFIITMLVVAFLYNLVIH